MVRTITPMTMDPPTTILAMGLLPTLLLQSKERGAEDNEPVCDSWSVSVINGFMGGFV
jgi:hypothetical protein